MVAVPEVVDLPASAAGFASRAPLPVHERRFVAVAVTAMELLRPESDLARLIEGAGRVDLLLATEDAPECGPAPIAVLDGGAVEDHHHGADGAPADTEEPPDRFDEVQAGAARLELPGLNLHRLGLRSPLGPPAEHDLVAALSELVGFDPEPGVYCLAPAPVPTDPARAVIDRAVARIAQVYGLPLLRYRCLELTVVTDPPAA